MADVFICDAIRTPFGRYGGALANVRTDDLAAIPIKALMERNPGVDWQALDDVIFGCANQAGEDNRNVARMALLLAGIPKEVPGSTVNRLCGSSMDAVGVASRAIKSGETELMIAGGVESMSRAPFVMGKADTAFSRSAEIFDTTIGWRFVNPLMKSRYGVDSMPETAENVAEDFKVSRADQDAFAYRTQQRWARAHAAGFFADELTPVTIPQKKGEPKKFDTDEHPRPETTLEALAKLKPVVKPTGTVTAGNASGVNDGSCALLLASAEAVKKYGLTPRARVIATAAAGVAPRIMGFAPAPATRKVLAKSGLALIRHGRDRAERSVRVAGAGCDARSRPAGRRRACESERRGDRDRASAGRERRAVDHYGDFAIAEDRRALCAVHHVHRSGAGHRDDSGTGLNWTDRFRYGGTGRIQIQHHLGRPRCHRHPGDGEGTRVHADEDYDAWSFGRIERRWRHRAESGRWGTYADSRQHGRTDGQGKGTGKPVEIRSIRRT